MDYKQLSMFPEYESESHQSLAMKIFSDFCCNGCTCQSILDHSKEVPHS
jgi:hypothetical protein